MNEALWAAGFAGMLAGLLSAWVLGLDWENPLVWLRPRCSHSPLDLVRCARRRNHRGRHMVYAADVMNAHYERTPF